MARREPGPGYAAEREPERNRNGLRSRSALPSTRDRARLAAGRATGFVYCGYVRIYSQLRALKKRCIKKMRHDFSDFELRNRGTGPERLRNRATGPERFRRGRALCAAATHRSSAGRNDQKDGEACWFALVLRALVEAGSAARF